MHISYIIYLCIYMYMHIIQYDMYVQVCIPYRAVHINIQEHVDHICMHAIFNMGTHQVSLELSTI
jgi:hypothetical protein